MRRCKKCLELNETPILMDLLMEKMKANITGLYSKYHKNGHRIFGEPNVTTP